MKKHIWFTMLLAGLLTITHTACDDDKDNFLEEFTTILYILNSGEQEIICYRTGENTTVELSVIKAGSDLSTSSAAKVNIWTEEQLAVYNAENYTAYKMMPADYYELANNTSLEFTGKEETFKKVEITFKTEELYTLENLDEYVLPLHITSSDSVNAKKNVVLYKPGIVVPSLYLEKNGYMRSSFKEGASEMTETLPVALPIQNKWEFDCTVEVDENLLEAYNETSTVTYKLLPSDAYSLSNNGMVTFTTDDDSKNLEIIASSKSLDYGNYILPLRLAKCSKETFMIDAGKDTYLYGVHYAPGEDKLLPVNLTVPMFDSNAKEPNEGSYEALVDNDITTYFHSAYSVAVDGAHYLQVNLDKAYTAFSFSFTTRHNNSAGNPTELIISGSMDNENYVVLDHLTEGFPTGTAETYESPVIAGGTFKYLRITMPLGGNNGGGSYFVYSGFSMKGL